MSHEDRVQGEIVALVIRDRNVTSGTKSRMSPQVFGVVGDVDKILCGGREERVQERATVDALIVPTLSAAVIDPDEAMDNPHGPTDSRQNFIIVAEEQEAQLLTNTKHSGTNR